MYPAETLLLSPQLIDMLGKIVLSLERISTSMDVMARASAKNDESWQEFIKMVSARLDRIEARMRAEIETIQ